MLSQKMDCVMQEVGNLLQNCYMSMQANSFSLISGDNL